MGASFSYPQLSLHLLSTSVPRARAPFASPLPLTLTFALAVLPSPPPLLSWTVTLEIDVAHRQAQHVLLTTTAPLAETVRLGVGADTLRAVQAQYSEAEIANVCALTLRGEAKGIAAMTETFVFAVGVDKTGVFRDVYGVLEEGGQNAREKSGGRGAVGAFSVVKR